MLQLLLVDKKITHPKELFKILDNAVKEKYPVLIVAEGIEQEALTPVIRNKLRGVLKAAAIKAPAFGERKSHCLDDLAVLTGGVAEMQFLCQSSITIYLFVHFASAGTVIRDEMGFTLENARVDMLGSASKVTITKDSTLIVTDGATNEAMKERVRQLQRLVEVRLRYSKMLRTKQPSMNTSEGF